MGKFGGKAALAEVAEVHITRVHRWLLPKEQGGTGGLIPLRHQQKLLNKARELGIDLTPADFFEQDDDHPSATPEEKFHGVS